MFPVGKKRGRIAIVELFGTIGGALRPTPTAQILEGLRESRRIRAVVLDIDSPGGSVAASEQLYSSVARLNERKPVVAFIRGYGASGAYMTACAARRIVALSGAIVGSIGVIAIHPVLEGLLQRSGVGVEVSKSGRLKDMGAPWRGPTDEERAKSQGLVDELNAGFLSLVARARHLDEERVRELATGEVFTGRRAQEMGLVDELGDLDRALDLAAELGQVPRRVVYARPRRGLLERLLFRMSSSLVDAAMDRVEALLFPRLYY